MSADQRFAYPMDSLPILSPPLLYANSPDFAFRFQHPVHEVGGGEIIVDWACTYVSMYEFV